ERGSGLFPGDNPVRDVDDEEGDRQRHEHGVNEARGLLGAGVRVDRIGPGTSHHKTLLRLSWYSNRMRAGPITVSSASRSAEAFSVVGMISAEALRGLSARRRNAALIVTSSAVGRTSVCGNNPGRFPSRSRRVSW